MSKVVSSKLCLRRFYLQTGVLKYIFLKNNSYLHTLQLLEITFKVIKDADRRHLMFLPVIDTWPRVKFINSMAAESFWAFGRNEGTNKKIRKHQLFKEY